MQKYNHKLVEQKWAKEWVDNKVFTPDLDKAKDPYYALFMFPYPSAEGLHIGNFYAFTCVDVMAKFKKLQGKDVFEPVGWDAFGIHSENYALKIGETPQKMLERTIANFRKQLQAAGLSCDWTREVDTTSPEYYKWTQWIFTKLFEQGLAYQKEALLNWCPSCKTVLADEQIEDGACERCKSVPEKKVMTQWFFKITEYADEMLEELESGDMDWSQITKSAQKAWIGKSEGAKIKFKIKNSDEDIEVFTTRPDTLFGATYMVLAPEHKLVQEWLGKIENKDEVEQYIKAAASKSEMDRIENKEKTGVELRGIKAINPANQEEIPVYIADYVLAGYGTGAIMAVPAHDERDYEFAKKYKIRVLRVIDNDEELPSVGVGTLTSSGEFDGMDSEEAKRVITEFAGGKMTTSYKLRDWCISRQRYWGPPVPIVYCDKCGAQAVPESDLPVKLPEMKEGWEPSGDGRGPLANVPEFMDTTCPSCGGAAQREADVMDNFLDSAWYFMRYISHDNADEIFNKDLAKKWLPVDLYVGGNEHAVLHLMYTRFITRALHDIGLINFTNPFKRFRANGMILKDGKKMSKSKGNVINPEEYGDKVSYDALKSYILFLGPLSEDRSFSDKGIMGTRRWMEKIIRIADKVTDTNDAPDVINQLHKTIKQVTDNFESQKYNTAIARLMEFTNTLSGVKEVSKETWQKFIVLCAPFLPALSEELNANIGNKSLFGSGDIWPEFDQELAKDDVVTIAVQVNGKVRAQLEVSKDAAEEDVRELVLADPVVDKWVKKTGEGAVKQFIYVTGRVANIVVQ